MTITKIIARPSALTFLLALSGFFAQAVTAQQLDTSVTIERFPVGSYPVALGFDGENVWVTSSFDNTVTKLRASDGANLGTFNLGGASYGVAFDGTNLWFTNGLTDTVTELRPSDGAILGNFPVGQN